MSFGPQFLRHAKYWHIVSYRIVTLRFETSRCSQVSVIFLDFA